MNENNNLIKEVFGEDVEIMKDSVKLYIPTIEQDGTEIMDISIQTRLEFFSQQMTNLFGGATITDGYGLWRDSDLNDHKETVHIITSNTTQLTREALTSMKILATTLKDISNQSAVTLEINNQMIFI